VGGGDGLGCQDPGRKSQFVKPYGEMEASEYVKFDWNAEDATAYSKAYHDVFSQKTMLPYLRIKARWNTGSRWTGTFPRR